MENDLGCLSKGGDSCEAHHREHTTSSEILVRCHSRLTTELSDSRPAVITPVTLDHQSASPKPATLELRSGAAVRSSDLVRIHFILS